MCWRCLEELFRNPGKACTITYRSGQKRVSRGSNRRWTDSLGGWMASRQGCAPEWAAACRYLGIDKSELAGRTRRIEIALARALIGYIATRELMISASELACRFNIDRSAVSGAARRAAHDSQLIEVAKEVLSFLYPTSNQQ
jgi:hypothetical protein